jgi:hypothetical protein
VGPFPRAIIAGATLLSLIVASGASVGAWELTSEAPPSLAGAAKRNVKRWRGGQMMLRWVAAGVLEAVKGFRRVKGCADMPTLVAALRARDQQLGVAISVENVA